MGIPIITTHITINPDEQGIPPWALVGLIQARLQNPYSPIFCITNQPNIPKKKDSPVLNTIDFVDLAMLSDVAEEFRSKYFHMSVNPRQFELHCIERWFIISELARRLDLKRFFCMDTDILLYTDVTEAASRFEGCEATTMSGCSWATVFFYNPRILKRFCRMVMEFYSRSSPIWKIGLDRIGILDPSRPVGNLSDMFLIELFVHYYEETRGVRFGVTDRPLEGRMFDLGICESEPGVEMLDSFKYLRWVDGQPWVKMVDDDAMVKMDCLHFQGMTKHIMTPTFNLSLKPQIEKLKSAAA